ncbi:Myosin heavy chain [Phytophthora palmivora]|uniref:Myosin heavy chain n=1 Tax=Phytophthora palmivora TaxID=4796 RepID=A0A2P4X7D1_9STRA|nr:Myosin heavy chain [Phytophthora palmivora]
MPSVHPIDTLSKKLRQQAMELTHVYEELEKQKLQIDTYKQQNQDQKRQLEKLREQRRKSTDGSSKAPTDSRVGALEQKKRAAQMMIGTPSTGASLGQKRGELDRKLKEAEREKKKYELAAKRIEKALVELQVFQNDRMEKLLLPEGHPNHSANVNTVSNDFQAVVNEQRAYIRVLEEAVHLKATDFEVTGHEELLIVLAELRHTIYEQEKDVEEKSRQLSSLQEQLEQEKQQHLATKDILSTTENHQKDIAKRFQEQESALRAKISEAELQVEERNQRLNQLQDASADALRTQEGLQNRLVATTKTLNLTESKLQDATRDIKGLHEKLDETTTKYDEEKQRNKCLHEECTKKQEHLDEINAFQEELLGSVDKYVSKVKKSRDKVERLEVELQSYKEKELLAQKQAEDAKRSSDERVSTLQVKVDTAECRMQQLQAQCKEWEQEKHCLQNTLADVQQNLRRQIEERSEMQQEITTKAKKYSQMEEVVAELEAALSTALAMMLEKESFQQITIEDKEGSSDADEHAFLLDPFVFQDLGSSCAILDSTAKMCQDEMEKRYDEIRDYRQQLAECMTDIEAYVMQVTTLDEKLHNAQAECKSYHALEQHVVNQEKALETKQLQICDLSVENDRLIAVEKAYSLEVATNERYSKRLEDQQAMMKEQREHVDELECALEDAAIFAEQQNDCNQQLTAKLAELKVSQKEQTEQNKTLEGLNSTFSSRFVELAKQFATFLRPVAATDRSLQNHLKTFDVEIQTGDVLRLLQLFPALLEEYITLDTCNSKQHPPTDAQRRLGKSTISTKKPQCLVEWSTEKSLNHEMATPARQISPKISSPAIPSQVAVSKIPVLAEKEEAQLAEQLELIRGAFQSYKQ